MNYRTLVAWTDKRGNDYNYVDEFFKQWESVAPEWHLGAGSLQDADTTPGTNNACETQIRLLREDAQHRSTGVGELLSSARTEVENYAQDDSCGCRLTATTTTATADATATATATTSPTTTITTNTHFRQ